MNESAPLGAERQFRLPDELQEMLLVHTGGVMYVRVDLAHVVEVPVEVCLGLGQLRVSIEHEMEVEFVLQPT